MADLKINYASLFDSLTDVEYKYAPKELFYQGNLDLLTTERRVSVVGSRNMSKNGAIRAKILTEALVKNNIIVVSGLAKGIDTIAHETAIRNGGKTIAVLGTPLDQVYPKENSVLLEKIKREHLAISQFPIGYPMGKRNFPMRNQTMALISDATIIVEANENSGTRHQGWEALRLGRQLFILQNVAEDPNLTWPRQMLDYGARVLFREDLNEIVADIPYFSSKQDFAF